MTVLQLQTHSLGFVLASARQITRKIFVSHAILQVLGAYVDNGKPSNISRFLTGELGENSTFFPVECCMR